MKLNTTLLRSYVGSGSVLVVLVASAVVALAPDLVVAMGRPARTVVHATTSLSWSAGPSLPSVRGRAVAVANDGFIFVMGGSTTADPRAVNRLGLDAPGWETAPMLDRERVAPGAGTTATGRIVVFGGRQASALSSTIEYNPFGDIVPFADYQNLADMGTARHLHGYARDSEGRLYAIGGLNQAGQVLASVERYDYATNTWTPLAALPEGRYAFAAAFDGAGHIFTFGGGADPGYTSVSARVNRYSIATDSWSWLAPMPVAVRESTAVLGPDGRIYVVGGWSTGGTLRDVWAYDPAGDSWSAEMPLPIPLRSATVVVDAKGRLVVIGGIDAASRDLAPVWMSQPAGTTADPADTEAPSVPTGLAATEVTQTTITLAWNASTDDVGVAGYRLYEYVKVNPYYATWVRRIDNIATPSVTATGLSPGERHRYAVTAFDAAGHESARSLPLWVTNLQPPLAYRAPGGGTAYAVVGQLFSYDVDAIGVPAPTFSLAEGPAGMTVDAITGIVQWTPGPADVGTAAATVRATNSEGRDDHAFSFPVYPAATDLEPPSPVWYVVATNITANGCTLSWGPATDNVGVAGYNILAQEAGHGGSLFLAGNSPGTGTTATINTLQPATSYRIWVAAYDAAGNVGSISGATPAYVTTLPSGPTNTPVPSPTPTSTHTPTAVPPTATPTQTPTMTPTPPGPTATVPLPPAPPTAGLYLSLAKDTRVGVGGLTEVGAEDIISFDGANFAMVFDGSDVGITHLNVHAFAFVDAATLLISFDKRVSVPGLGFVEAADIVKFTAVSLGADTAGTFSPFFDGSAVGLDRSDENIDALELVPDGRLLISTKGMVQVPGVFGRKEDLLAFSPAVPGDYSAGTWAMYFDGSDISMDKDIDGVAVAAGGDIYLTTKDDVVLSGVLAGKEDVFVCTPTSLGNVTACGGPSVFFDGSAFGLSDNDVDGIDLP